MITWCCSEELVNKYFKTLNIRSRYWLLSNEKKWQPHAQNRKLKFGQRHVWPKKGRPEICCLLKLHPQLWSLVLRKNRFATGNKQLNLFLSCVMQVGASSVKESLVYTLIFHSNKFQLYLSALKRVWFMFLCFGHHHYDKSPLVFLSSAQKLFICFSLHFKVRLWPSQSILFNTSTLLFTTKLPLTVQPIR